MTNTVPVWLMAACIALALAAGVFTTKSCMTPKTRVDSVKVEVPGQTVYVDTGGIRTVTRYREVTQYLPSDSTARLDSLRNATEYLRSKWYESVAALAEWEVEVETVDTAITRTARLTVDGQELASEWVDSLHIERQTFPRSYSIVTKDAEIPIRISTEVQSVTDGHGFWTDILFVLAGTGIGMLVLAIFR